MSSNKELVFLVGRRIKEYREHLGYSQSELASASRCSQHQIWQYEAGNQAMTLVTLQRIAEALNVPAYYLLYPDE